MKKLVWVFGFLWIAYFGMVAQGYEVGDKIEKFSAPNDEGNTWNAAAVLGKANLVVYFYPAAMTGGCTKQACAYRDDKLALDSLNATVVGISGDEVQNLKYFKKAHDLNFTLLSDPEGKIATRFGVPVTLGEKSIDREIEGEQYTLSRLATTARWTFVVDKKGKVIYKASGVDAANDSKNVLQALKEAGK